MTLGHNLQGQLRGIVARIVEVEDQIEEAKEKYVSPIRDGVKVLYVEAASLGFNKKAVREVVRKAKMTPELRDDIDLYEHAALREILE